MTLAALPVRTASAVATITMKWVNAHVILVTGMKDGKTSLL